MTSDNSAFFDALATTYIVERELGRGGMATVYLARDLRHDRSVALKVLRSRVAAVARAPSASCARSSSPPASSTPTSCRSTTRARADGLLWYTMPYVEGETLRERLDAGAALRLDEALRIAREVADALATRTSTGSSTATSSPRTSC